MGAKKRRRGHGRNRIGGGRLKQIAAALEVTPDHFFGLDGKAKGDAETSSEMIDLMTKPGALTLLRNYAKLKPDGREAINHVIAMMAGHHGKPP
jgi:hypothetical protein